MKEKLQSELFLLGLERYLEKMGIDQECISKSKNNIASTCGEKEYYYDEKEEIKGTLIPLSKVKGVSRMEGLSWFDMLDYGSTHLPKEMSYEDFNLSTDRFLNILGWLDENDLNEVKYRFINTGNIHFDCFKNGDQEEYYQHTDGNHRVIVGKVLGIDEIKASRVNVYEYNAEKHRAYKILKEKEKEVKEIVNELGLDFNKNEIVLEKGNYFEVVHFFTYRESSLRFDFSEIDTMIKEMDYLLKYLTRIRSKVHKLYKIYQSFPEFARRIVLRIASNGTDEKAIAHMIALSKD